MEMSRKVTENVKLAWKLHSTDDNFTIDHQLLF